MSYLVELNGVSKIYPRVNQPWERLKAFSSLLVGKEPASGAQVLSDISLKVERGESLGVIGENGAGKSTLLKVLTGIVKPTHGTVVVNGSTAALLELGAGFQPDFSGIDNVRMKASLLGISGKALDEKLEYILDFADIGEYIHEPVKHYSSGMVVRLGFAVVAASQPELLITDEVLAVGDESFQKKCVRWMERFLNDGGTLLMVSHSMFLVQKLCQKAIWVHDGKARAQGGVFPVTQEYLAWHESRSASEKALRDQASGDSGLYQVSGFGISAPEIDDIPCLEQGSDLEATLDLYSPDGRRPVGLFGLVRADGTPVYGVGTDIGEAQCKQLESNVYRFHIKFPGFPFLPGSYSIRGHAMDPEGVRVCDTREIAFKVTGDSRELGFIKLPHEWLV